MGISRIKSEKVLPGSIAVMALSVHTSDRLQPLDVTVFGAMNHYSKMALVALVAPYMTLSGGFKAKGNHVCDCYVKGTQRVSQWAPLFPGLHWLSNYGVLCENGTRISVHRDGLVSTEEFKGDLRRNDFQFEQIGLLPSRLELGFVNTNVGIELTREDVRYKMLYFELQRREKNVKTHWWSRTSLGRMCWSANEKPYDEKL